MAKHGTKVLSWVVALALLVAAIAPFATARPRPAHADVTVGTVAVAAAPATIGVPAAYTFTYTDTAGGAQVAGDLIRITFPNTMPLANVTGPGLLAVLTMASAVAGTAPAVVVAAVVAPPAGTTVAVAGQTVTITLGGAFGAAGAGNVNAIVFGIGVAGVSGQLRNPPAETGNDIFQIATSHALAAISANTASADVVYNHVAGVAGVTGGAPGFLPQPFTARAAAQYTVVFNNAAAVALAAGVDQITVRFPAGVTLPAAINRANVSILGQVVAPPAAPVLVTLNNDPIVNTATREVTLTIPSLTAAGGAVQAAFIPAGAVTQVVFQAGTGITNPNTGGIIGGAATALCGTGCVASTQATTPVFSPGNMLIVRTLANVPGFAARGATVTSTATGFAVGSSATLWLDNGAAGGVALDGIINGGEVTLGSATVGADGTATITWTAAVPPLGAGATAVNATLRVRDNSGVVSPWSPQGVNFADPAAFTTLASMTASPNTGPRATVITLTGQDFVAGAVPDGPDLNLLADDGITIGGVACGPAVALAVTAAGTLPAGTTCTVPAGVPTGPATVRIFMGGVPPTAASASATVFTVAASALLLSPATAVPNQLLVVSGSGFSAGPGNVAACPGVPPNPGCVAVGGVTLGGAAFNTGVAPQPGIIAMDASGNLPATTFTVPAAQASGPAQLVVTDAGGLQGTATLTVPVRNIAIDQTTSRRGTILTVTGTGWPSARVVNVTYGPALAPLAAVSATASVSGDFTTNLTVPNAAPINGTTILTATEPISGLANQNTVQHTVPGPTLAATPTSVPLGGTLRIVGTGFPGFAPVGLLTVGGLNVLPAAGVNTDATGGFTISTIVPAQNIGTAAVAVAAGGVTGTVNVNVVAAAANVAAQLQPIATVLTRAWRFNNATGQWQLFDPAGPAIANDLVSYVPGDAAVIIVSAATTLQTATFTTQLRAGVNIIGWR